MTYATENVVEERKLSGQFDLSNNIFILSNIRTENSFLSRQELK